MCYETVNVESQYGGGGDDGNFTVEYMERRVRALSLDKMLDSLIYYVVG